MYARCRKTVPCRCDGFGLKKLQPSEAVTRRQLRDPSRQTSSVDTRGDREPCARARRREIVASSIPVLVSDCRPATREVASVLPAMNVHARCHLLPLVHCVPAAGRWRRGNRSPGCPHAPLYASVPSPRGVCAGRPSVTLSGSALSQLTVHLPLRLRLQCDPYLRTRKPRLEPRKSRRTEVVEART